MRVLKLELEGLTTSFRYPHFMWGRHPSFPMPPPATIYGHICSAVGEWVDPNELEFGYLFTHDGEATDLEHCHTVRLREDALKDKATKGMRDWERESGVLVNLGGTINPLSRDFLFRPRLTLYVNRPDWMEYFRNPRYPVVLGRSQDLATYKRISVVELEKRGEAYYEHTLLPFAWRVRTGRGVTLTMPRFVDYRNNREPQFDRYIALRERANTTGWLRYEEDSLDHWIDPEAPEWRGDQRGVVFHRFVQ